METIFKNSNVRVAKTATGLSWFDLTDNYNDFKGFTQAKRGLDKAVATIEKLAQDENLKEGVRMGTITEILDSLKMKPHTYCGMD